MALPADARITYPGTAQAHAVPHG